MSTMGAQVALAGYARRTFLELVVDVNVDDWEGHGWLYPFRGGGVCDGEGEG